MRREAFIYLALGIITLIGFYPVSQLGFIYYDDYGIPGYIVDNPDVQAGITPASIHWAFTAMYCGNWHPLTWLSHMVDCQLFGLKPAGHHLTSLAFHIANTLLLFLLLRQVTNALWRSAMVAALFALHPLHVQSVAWASERKDLLCAFFFLLTLLAYTRHVRAIKIHGRSRLWYGVTLMLFACALMSKPMAITLPFILLLLDHWPLARWQGVVQPSGVIPLVKAWQPLVLEKIPFFILCAGSSFLTLKAQGESVAPLDYVPLDWRIMNSLVAYVTYLGKTIWPVHLAIFYPLVRLPAWQVACSALFLILLSVLVIHKRRSAPGLLVGWIWFLVMLIPVIGLVQVSLQAMADRYDYLPSIGLFIMVVWWFTEITGRMRFQNGFRIFVAIAVLSICLLITRWQLGFWQDSVTLFNRAIAVTGNNPVSNMYLGQIYEATGDMAEAARNYRLVLSHASNVKQIHSKLGYVLDQSGDWPGAQEQFSEVLRLDPTNIEAILFLGNNLSAEGKYTEAHDFYANALVQQPDNGAIQSANAFNDLNAELEKQLPALLEEIRTNPTAEAYARVAEFRKSRGNYPEAVDYYSSALKLQPENPQLLNNLGWILATCRDKNVRDGQRAVSLARHACELTQYNETFLIGTLGAAYAEAGDFEDAIATAQRAYDLAVKKGETGLTEKNLELLMLYRRHQAYRER